MRKSRAIFILFATLAAIAGYVAWAAWEPAPTLQSMTFSTNVDADARSAAEADFRAHPPKARKLTWKILSSRLANPYQPREKPSIHVGIIPHTDGAKLLSVHYPRGYVYFHRGWKDGKWRREYVSAPDL
jgi:hypothetical protein